MSDGVIPEERVVPIRKGTPIPETRHEPDENVIKELEWLLGAARAGEIRGFAYAAYHFDGSSFTRYVGLISNSLVGALFGVMSRMNKQLNDDS